MKCLIDLDGVLVDFVGRACDLHCKPNPYEQEGGNTEYDLYKLWGMSPEEFWSPMGYDFWASLDWCADGRDVLDICFRKFGQDNCFIATSPCKTRGCESGKAEWVKLHIPELSRQTLIGPPKHVCAHKGTVLIDDYYANVRKFRRHGGRAVLMPRPWSDNPHYSIRLRNGEKPLDILRFELDGIKL